MRKNTIVSLLTVAAVAVGVIYLYSKTHALDFIFGANTGIE